MKANKKNKNKNKNKGGQADKAKKGPASNGSWEEMLNQPLPDEESTAAGDMTLDTTMDVEEKKEETLDASKAEESTVASAATAETTEGGEEPKNKKKRKKRANKNTVAKLKEVRREFMDRCVSPGYQKINRVHLNGEVTLTNLKGQDEADGVYNNTRSKKKMKLPPKAEPAKAEENKSAAASE